MARPVLRTGLRTNSPMTARALAAIVCLLGSAAAEELPAPITPKSVIRPYVDQFGYRPDGRKVIIVASDQPMPETLDLSIRDAKTNKDAWTLKDHAGAFRPYSNGQKDKESGDFTAHLDATDLKTPGRYFVAVSSGGKTERSYVFSVADDVYRASGLAAWKAFYYNRADTEIPEKHGGLWTHKLSHNGPNQSKEARLYKWTGAAHWDPVGKEVADPTPRDVHGGWWDAGNFDKYMGNTTVCHNELLLGVQLLGDSVKDNDLSIPESGNGVPDVLDEVRCATEFLIRLADETGAGFGRVYEKTACPPEADTTPVMLTQTTSGATINRAAALAYASVVWQERKLDPAFAKKCMEESLKSWKLLETKPHPWPADPKDPKKIANTGNWFTADFERCRALAAACYFRATGDRQYDKIVQEAAAKWKPAGPGEGEETWPIIWVYVHTPGADADLVKKMKQLVLSSADGVVKQTGADRGYAAGIRGYWWGSNRLVGHCGVNCLLAAELAEDKTAKQKYLDAAEEYVHYLHGRNPVGLCYLSNMKQYGAENSVMVMFHAWVGADGKKESAKYIGEGPGKIGPFPGMVVGGANGGMKKYVNVLDWRTNPWEFNEPCISYQSPCAVLLGYFALKLR